MASDFDKRVVAIQGNAVKACKLTATEDGYVLTWVDANDEWEAKPPRAKESYQFFTSDGYWTAPPGVSIVRLFGWGGGGGGSAAWVPAGGGGGGGSISAFVAVPIVPNTTYAITIGAGGMGGVFAATLTNGLAGGATSFGSLAYFRGASGGGLVTPGAGGFCITANGLSVGYSSSISSFIGAGGGAAFGSAITDSIGTPSLFAMDNNGLGNGIGGAPGSGSLEFVGAGGGAGPNGAGAAGGSSDGVTGNNGSDAADNSGAGGGGGAGAASGSPITAYGSGGNGGSGGLYVMWIE